MERTDNGVLIAFEGIDGAGKTTQVDLLERFFVSAQMPVKRAKEPTEEPWGQKLRQSATNGRMTWQNELHAVIEDRKQHVREVIRPALDKGHTFILDRYFYSTIAYQGTHGGDAATITASMLEMFPKPDVVILLDVPVEVGQTRIHENRSEGANAFETVSSLRAVQKVFLDLAKTQSNIVLVNGTPPIDTIHKTILTTLLNGVLTQKHCAKAYGCEEPLYCSYRLSETCPLFKMRKQAGIFAKAST